MGKGKKAKATGRVKASPWVDSGDDGRMTFREWCGSDMFLDLLDMLRMASSRKTVPSGKCLEFLCIDSVWCMADAVDRRIDTVDDVESGGKSIDWRNATASEVFDGIKAWTSSDTAGNILAVYHDEISEPEFATAMTFWAGEP